ncbi:MAG: DUF1963 domain-containing protein, partial [Pseudomonadota bacterium]
MTLLDAPTAQPHDAMATAYVPEATAPTEELASGAQSLGKDTPFLLRRLWPAYGASLSGSRLGGAPDLPSAIPWPCNESHRRPLHFLAQIHCKDIPRAAPTWLPREGKLLFFAEISRHFDWQETPNRTATRVIHVPAHLADTPPQAPPTALPFLGLADDAPRDDYARHERRQFEAWPLTIEALPIGGMGSLNAALKHALPRGRHEQSLRSVFVEEQTAVRHDGAGTRTEWYLKRSPEALAFPFSPAAARLMAVSAQRSLAAEHKRLRRRAHHLEALADRGEAGPLDLAQSTDYYRVCVGLEQAIKALTAAGRSLPKAQRQGAASPPGTAQALADFRVAINALLRDADAVAWSVWLGVESALSFMATATVSDPKRFPDLPADFHSLFAERFRPNRENSA